MLLILFILLILIYNLYSHIVNLVLRAKGSKRVGLITVESIDGAFTDEDGDFVCLAVFDCRGCTLEEFSLQGEWLVDSSESGATFEVELDEDEDDWADYDESAAVSISLLDMECEIRTV
eukprot:TRINITY_DN645_c0_g1_i2.p1 TRINITY_DN645_c0_g1~~TRINITY_DN645_c0_g1_i2.p1  ORF type:complete len:119 (+),score=25.33 TRINITY_DN645_c0_g1_i2:605-961(+)